eukprot:Gb_24564 [translate_table: standard]
MNSFIGYGKVEDLDQLLLLRETKRKRRVIIISVASVVLVAIVTCVAARFIQTNLDKEENVAASELQEAIEAVCKTTRYSEECVSSLASYAGSSRANPENLAGFAVMVAMNEVDKAFALASNLVKEENDQTERFALQDCVQLIDITKDQLTSSLSHLNSKSLTTQHFSDVQTWLSASITNQDTCMDGLTTANGNGAEALLKSRLHNVTHFLSNSLAIVNSKFFTSSKPSIFNLRASSGRKEFYPGGYDKDGNPSWLSAEDRRLLHGASKSIYIQPDVIVAQDGSGKYKTIQAAVDAAPNNSKKRYVIRVKKGTYKEHVEVNKQKTNLMIIGDGMEATVVTGSRNVVDGSTTFDSATFVAVGKGFIAQDMAFVNTAGPSKNQAVALRVGSDQSVLYRCKIMGYQDTLYVHSLRQFYRECRILGTVDFVFGNAAVVFQSCTLLARKPLQNQKNAITAQGRTDPNQNTGISIHSCSIAADADLVAVKSSFPTYLGRPWKNYSRTVFMQSSLGDLIHPAGWLEWDRDFALKTLYYGEYKNSGPGSGTAKRVKWPGYRVITSPSEARKFTVGEFIQGNAWLQSTGVAYVDGLIE